MRATSRQRIIETIIGSWGDDARFVRVDPTQYKFLFAVIANRGYFLVTGRSQVRRCLGRDEYRSIAAEAKAAGLDRKTLHIYATIATYLGPGIEFYHTPQLDLAKGGAH